MNPYSKKQAYFEIHLAIFIWSFTAILGDLITLSALVLVWWRVFICSISLIPFVNFKLILKQYNRKLFLIIFSIGAILSLHWVAFYGSIKLGNASVTLLCASLTPVFSALIDSLINLKKIVKTDIVLGIALIFGMTFVSGTLTANFHIGLLVGILASILSALSIVLTKKYVDGIEQKFVTFLTMSSACFFLTLLIPIFIFQNENTIFFPSNFSDIFYLVILATICTSFTNILFLRSIQHLNAFDACLTIALEPVYGTFLAILILKENKELSTNFYIGSATVISIVMLDIYIKNKVIKR